MSEKKKQTRVKARLPKGMRDIEAHELRALRGMIEKISAVYERYGFEPLDTPAFEYTDALGKFLPDTDRPNEGVFSLQDEDDQWMSLRYDLTAPLARYVAANYDQVPKPFRRYQYGHVYRNEKPGPGRFRQFMQFDADTVGTANPAADAEMCMMACDALEALGIPSGSYVIKVSNRKILDAVLATIGLAGEENEKRRLTVLRAIDKADKFPLEEVAKLLGAGRKDESGDFTAGAGLSSVNVDIVLEYISTGDNADFFVQLEKKLSPGTNAASAMRDLVDILEFISVAGLNQNVRLDTSVVRGLEYYTGPVFEAELTLPATDESGQPIRFGSVGGGGRYDGLVSRFVSNPTPATGFSLGLSRLYAALNHLGKLDAGVTDGPVVVLVLDQDNAANYQKMAQNLRNANIRAEMYVGDAGIKAQMKYADKRGAPCVIIQGSDERERGEVTIKDLKEGARLAGEIADHAEWRDGRPAQFSVPAADLVPEVQKLLAKQRRK